MKSYKPAKFRKIILSLCDFEVKRLIFKVFFYLESPVKFLRKSGVKTTSLLDWCYQSSLLEAVYIKNVYKVKHELQ